MNRDSESEETTQSAKLLSGESPRLRKSESISPDKIDSLVESAVFGTDNSAREDCRRKIRKLASSFGIFPASIQNLYEAAGKGLYHDVTVPAINIRGLTYQVARAV
ncbi:MAG: hypothetical protein CO103_00565, partial [Chloroflexi bacterium CG_4_9_14_3_um_filter_45_9]